jgi:hypothetical protein
MHMPKTLLAIFLCSTASIYSAANAAETKTILICNGKGNFGKDNFSIDNDILTLTTDNAVVTGDEVKFKANAFFLGKSYDLEVTDGEYHYHKISNNKVDDILTINRFTLEFDWGRLYGDDFASVSGECKKAEEALI